MITARESPCKESSRFLSGFKKKNRFQVQQCNWHIPLKETKEWPKMWITCRVTTILLCRM